MPLRCLDNPTQRDRRTCWAPAAWGVLAQSIRWLEAVLGPEVGVMLPQTPTPMPAPQKVAPQEGWMLSSQQRRPEVTIGGGRQPAR